VTGGDAQYRSRLRQAWFSPIPIRETVMLPKAENAIFVIADVSGYTKFFAAVEIEHANDIVADFLGTVVEALRPTFRLAKFEGDAAFLYAVGGGLDGSMLEDVIEAAYFRFRRRRRDVRQASACTCKACAAMGDLDFKFVIHHGEMVRQSIGGREEIAGRDVILVHRLLKNAVYDRFGGRAYALYSDACLRTLGVDPAARGLSAHRESIDIIGDVETWHRDLEAAWQKDDARRRIEVAPEEAYLTWRFELPAPRRTVWEHMTVPGHWQQWWFAEAIVEQSEDGRRGVGTTNHCMHGKDAVIEEILDWQPFDYVTIGITLPIPGAPLITMTRALTDGQDGGTVLEMRVARPQPEHAAFVDKAATKFSSNLLPAVERLRAIFRDAPAPIAAAEEPPLPAKRELFLHEPVSSGAPG
jgi:uncharacterized protein YndB with AHSA1/START domain